MRNFKWYIKKVLKRDHQNYKKYFYEEGSRSEVYFK